MLGLGRLSKLRVLQLDLNPRLDVLEVTQSMCCKPQLFDVPLLMGWDARTPIASLETVSFGLPLLQLQVRTHTGMRVIDEVTRTSSDAV